MIYIYKITSPSGRIYIGQTKNINKRKHLYKGLKCKTQFRLYASLLKYTWKEHVFETVAELPEEYGDDAEISYISYYKAYHTDGGLNLTRGGLRPKMTQETKNKLSEAIMGDKNARAKKLYQYTLEKELVKEWNCMKCIERELGYGTSWLSIAAKNNKQAYGYLWSYVPMH
jgi:hypothetical protein